MIYLLILLLLLLVAYCVYLKLKNVKEFWKKKGVISTDFHPILGSLTFLQRKNPAIWMRELYNNVKSRYVGIWLFWRPALVINCPKIARRVLILDADVFKNRLVSSGKRDPVGALNIFTLNDPLWSSIRKRLTPLFTPAKLKAQHQIFHEKSSNLVQRLKDELGTGNRINLREVYADYTTDLIGEALFGIKCDATLLGHGVLTNTTKKFTKYNMWRGLAWSSIFFFPELVDIFGFSYFPKASVAYFKKVFSTIVEQRGGYDKKIIEQVDFLDALLKIKQEAKQDNEEINEDVILAQAVIFLQAGFNTSSTNLAYLTYELAYNPQYQEKLYNELADAKQKLGDREFDAKVLMDLPYLNCAIKEVLRKYPIMGWLDRIASTDYKIDDELTISAGTVLYVNAVGMQMDPDYFPEPEAFKPERFLPENAENIPSYTFMPFGEGPRHCIGERFGMYTLRYGLAFIVLNYKFEPWENSRLPNDCEVEKKGLFYVPGETLSVKIIPRK